MLGDLAEAGIDIDEVTRLLEREGVQKFEDSWEELLASVTDQLAKATTAVTGQGKA